MKILLKIVTATLSCLCMISLIGCSSTNEEVAEEIVYDLTTPEGVLEYLQVQNEAYITALVNDGDISAELREETVEDGQSPYVTVLTCSDSRVTPEHIFMEGLGSIFTIRNAGNVVDDVVLGSIEYGAEHLGTPVILVLGHTSCGAIDATIQGGNHGNILSVTEIIEEAIGSETDAEQAQILNVQQSIDNIMESEIIQELVEAGEVIVVGAIYDTSTGEVTFLDYEYKEEVTVVDETEVTDESMELYDEAVLDAMVAEEDEIKSLVCLNEDEELVTFNEEDQVLLCTWHSYPDSYPEGETISLDYGNVWTFTDQEIIAWYAENEEEIDDYELRLKQLIGLLPDDDNTHVTAMWVSIDDVIRPAYQTDPTVDLMVNIYEDDMLYQDWFDANIISSYYGEYQYPWTRLGYTYDWADNGEEYGLTEFLVLENSEVEIEFTYTTEEFIAYIGG